VEQKSRLNENNTHNNFGVKTGQVSLPVVGVMEFFNFNFSKLKGLNQDKCFISPHNLCKRIELKLEQIARKQNWNTPHDIRINLNFPDDARFRYHPLRFKYVYDYFTEHKTQNYFEHLDVPEEVLIKPVDISFSEFYLI
jgi:hypothetical protein